VELSVVMPLWNEVHVLEDVLAELERDLVARFEGDVEVVVVDDASTDGSGALLDRLAAERPWLEVLRNSANRGHGPSVRTGFEHAGGEWIFALDSDGNVAAADFWRLWERRQDADLVLGIRTNRTDGAHRQLLTRIVRIVVSALAGRRLSDANVPFRLLRRELWAELRGAIGESTLAPSIFVSLGAAVRGRRIVQVPVGYRARPQDISTLRWGRLVSFSARGLGQLVAFRIQLARGERR
jgi:glycosyltransferase involved in cell wall biosynthesis